MTPCSAGSPNPASSSNRRACWPIAARGGSIRPATTDAWRDVSLIKVAVPAMLQRIADRAMQVFGAMGGSDDTPIHQALAWGRLLRIGDGPDEVHLRQIFRMEPMPILVDCELAVSVRTSFLSGGNDSTRIPERRLADDGDRATQTSQKPRNRQGAAAQEISRGAQQAAATRRQRSVSRGRGTARPLSRRSLHAGHPARPEDRLTLTFRFHRRRLCRARHRGAADGGRHQGRPHHREGRRLRRHLVLEPISRRAMRYRLDGLYAVARRNRPHAVGEIRACAGNSGALPAHRQAIRALRQRAVPLPRSTSLDWDAAQSRWIIRTTRGDAFTAQFVGMGTGPLHVPKLPGIAGIERFKGHSFHTSRWDYDYTGGDPWAR